MKELSGKVAVVTGGASGIGFALAARAARAAREGMRVVVADVEEAALEKATEALRKTGATVLGVRTDVSKAAEVEALAQKALDAFGAVHLLFNNAGVAAGGATVWETTPADWEWVLAVNLWGVIHGVRVFLPIMLAQGVDGHVVNTGSTGGLFAPGWGGAYEVSKFGVVALTESLYHNLMRVGAKVRASVLCPAWVRTRLLDAARNRQREVGGTGSFEAPSSREDDTRWSEIARGAAGIGGVKTPEEIAQRTFEAIRKEQLYILTHLEGIAEAVRSRAEDIVTGRNPQAG